MNKSHKVPDIEHHLRMVAARIDERTGHFGEQAFIAFRKNICGHCRDLLKNPVPHPTAMPDDASRGLMLKAAQTKRSIPAPPRWALDSDMVARLEKEFANYGRALIGPCSRSSNTVADEKTIIIMPMPDGTVSSYQSAEVGASLLWWKLSEDDAFMLQLMQTYEPYAGRLPFAEFRRRFLRLCVDFKVATPDRAQEALRELGRQYFNELAN